MAAAATDVPTAIPAENGALAVAPSPAEVAEHVDGPSESRLEEGAAAGEWSAPVSRVGEKTLDGPLLPLLFT